MEEEGGANLFQIHLNPQVYHYKNKEYLFRFDQIDDREGSFW